MTNKNTTPAKTRLTIHLEAMAAGRPWESPWATPEAKAEQARIENRQDRAIDAGQLVWR